MHFLKDTVDMGKRRRKGGGDWHPMHWFTCQIPVLKPGAGNPSWVYHTGGRNSITWTITWYLSGYTLAGNWNFWMEPGLEPRHYNKDVSISSRSLTAAPDTLPFQYAIFMGKFTAETIIWWLTSRCEYMWLALHQAEEADWERKDGFTLSLDNWVIPRRWGWCTDGGQEADLEKKEVWLVQCNINMSVILGSPSKNSANFRLLGFFKPQFPHV